MKREKIVEREEFSYEEKIAIAQKSNEKCCHCGKKVYFEGYGATVDHYIPIFKGGTNRDINMIMLCEDCNKEKDAKIIPPRDYLHYLKEEHLKKLEGYFDSYIKSFEYLSRRRILSCDEYIVEVPPFVRDRRKKIRGKEFTLKFRLKRAGEKELEKIIEFYIEYLTKHNRLDDYEAAIKNIEFWYKFGCIMYIEGKDGIKNMFAITIRNLSPYTRYQNIPQAIQMVAFSKYGNIQNAALLDISRSLIISKVAEEQNLETVISICSLLESDPLSYVVTTEAGKYHCVKDIPGFVSNYGIHFDSEYDDPINDPNIEKQLNTMNEFFATFEEVQKEAQTWCSKKENEGMDWMLLFLKDIYDESDEVKYRLMQD